MNLQPLKYRIVTGDEVARLLPLTRWAAALKDKKLPPENHGPSAFIVICHDNAVTPFNPIFLKDVGITAEVIMLSATEAGYGGCIIGSANPDAVCECLSIPKSLEPKLVLALGVPDETVVLTEAENGSVAYYRDENNVHYAPKRKLEDIII
jgi:nitroreductase